MPEILHIRGQAILPGEQRDIELDIAELPTHTPITMPVSIRRAKKDGPVLLLIAGMHGDEINGIEIVRRLMVDRAVALQQGTVIAVPLLNVFGFIRQTRDTPDGKDVNRNFPGTQTGSLAARLAYCLMTTVLPWADYCVDFHTGGASRSNHPQIRLDFKAQADSMPLAEAFGSPLILNSKVLDKSFRKEASRMGKPVMVYEGGESMRMDDLAVEEGILGTLRLMSHLGMINSNLAPPPPHSPRLLNSSQWIRARAAGIFRPIKHNGEFVKKNEVMGSLTDPYGKIDIKMKAPHDGYVISTNYMPVVNQGDALWHFGKP